MSQPVSGPASRQRLRRVLWIDSVAGAAVGAAVLALLPGGLLGGLTGMPDAALLAMGVANLGYAGCAFAIARRQTMPLPAVRALAGANAAWALACGLLIWGNVEAISALGLAYVGGEALFVAGLASVEAKLAATV